MESRNRNPSNEGWQLARAVRQAIGARWWWPALALGAPGLALAGPDGEDVVAGSASVSRPDGANTIINQSSDRAIIQWQTFSVGGSEYVRFIQPGASSVALNRVVGPDPSSILGSLSANGKVFLVNPRGVYFGPGAHVDVNALVATVMDIDDQDFLDGRYEFVRGEDVPDGASVINEGTIVARDGGYVVLAADRVENSGVIQARLGTVGLGSGASMTLDVEGDGLVEFVVDEKVVTELAGVKNSGEVYADGGRVFMTAKVQSDLLATAVNNEGLVSATGIAESNGEIYLTGDGGAVVNSGTIDASSDDGSSGGLVDIRSDTDITLTAGSLVDISATGAGDGDGGEMVTWADGKTDFQPAARIDARGGDDGSGGHIELSGNTVDRHGQIDNTLGGSLLIDPIGTTIGHGASCSANYCEDDLALDLQTMDVTIEDAQGIEILAGGSASDPFDVRSGNENTRLCLAIGSATGCSPFSSSLSTTGGEIISNSDILADGELVFLSGRNAGIGQGTISLKDVTGRRVGIGTNEFGFVEAGGTVTVGNVTAVSNSGGNEARAHIEGRGNVRTGNITVEGRGARVSVLSGGGNVNVNGEIDVDGSQGTCCNSAVIDMRAGGGNLVIGDVTNRAVAGGSSDFANAEVFLFADGNIQHGDIDNRAVALNGFYSDANARVEVKATGSILAGDVTNRAAATGTHDAFAMADTFYEAGGIGLTVGKFITQAVATIDSPAISSVEARAFADTTLTGTDGNLMTIRTRDPKSIATATVNGGGVLEDAQAIAEAMVEIGAPGDDRFEGTSGGSPHATLVLDGPTEAIANPTVTGVLPANQQYPMEFGQATVIMEAGRSGDFKAVEVNGDVTVRGPGAYLYIGNGTGGNVHINGKVDVEKTRGTPTQAAGRHGIVGGGEFLRVQSIIIDGGAGNVIVGPNGSLKDHGVGGGHIEIHTAGNMRFDGNVTAVPDGPAAGYIQLHLLNGGAITGNGILTASILDIEGSGNSDVNVKSRARGIRLADLRDAKVDNSAFTARSFFELDEGTDFDDVELVFGGEATAARLGQLRDPQLFLFAINEEDGLAYGQYGNDDTDPFINGFEASSTPPPGYDDLVTLGAWLGPYDFEVNPHGPRIFPDWMLVVAPAGYEPMSSVGQIFRDPISSDEIRVPNSPVSGSNLSSWEGEGTDSGAYVLNISGVLGTSQVFNESGDAGQLQVGANQIAQGTTFTRKIVGTLDSETDIDAFLISMPAAIDFSASTSRRLDPKPAGLKGNFGSLKLTGANAELDLRNLDIDVARGFEASGKDVSIRGSVVDAKTITVDASRDTTVADSTLTATGKTTVSAGNILEIKQGSKVKGREVMLGAKTVRLGASSIEGGDKGVTIKADGGNVSTGPGTSVAKIRSGDRVKVEAAGNNVALRRAEIDAKTNIELLGRDIFTTGGNLTAGLKVLMGADQSIDATGATIESGDLFNPFAGGEINLTDASVQAGKMVANAGGDILISGASLSAGAMFLNGANILNGPATLAVGGGTLDGVTGDLLLLDILSGAGVSVGSTSPNLVAIARDGLLDLGQTTLDLGGEASYLWLQADDIRLGQVVNEPGALIVQMTPYTLTKSIGLEQVRGTGSEVNFGFDTHIAQFSDSPGTTIVFGHSQSPTGLQPFYEGNFDVGFDSPFDVGSRNLVFVSSGELFGPLGSGVDSLGLSSSGIIAFLDLLISGSPDEFPSVITDEIAEEQAIVGAFSVAGAGTTALLCN